MADVTLSGTIAAVSSLTGVGHTIKEEDFELIVLDAWPLYGTVSAVSSVSGYVGITKGFKGAISAVSSLTHTNSVWVSGGIDSLSSVTGSAQKIASGKGTIVSVSSLIGKSYATKPLWGPIGTVSSVAGRLQGLYPIRGTISAVSYASAAGTGSTVQSKELYVKHGSDWTKILPRQSVVVDLDGGTF